MPSYKLLYFQARGAAEISRLVFAVAGQEYEDIRYSREEWPSKKSEMPLSQMPVLEVDGKKMCQSAAIDRYLAREFGLMGKSNLETFRIEELHEAITELYLAMTKAHFEQDEKKKAEMQKTIQEETFPKFLTFFEKRLCENGNDDGYYVGKELSFGDIVLYYAIANIHRIASRDYSEDPVAKFPKLQGLYARVEAHPKIADWIKKRPVTEF